MPDANKDTESSLSAGHAMNTVLEAENSAKQAVQQCADEAEVLLLQARQKAKAISERVDNRITRIHQRCSRVVTDKVGQLERDQQQRARDTHSYKVDTETVDVVVEQIAEMLTTTE